METYKYIIHTFKTQFIKSCFKIIDSQYFKVILTKIYISGNYK